MKKNGFTMVEIVVVIALLGVLAIIIGTNIVSLQSKQKDKNYNAFKERLESAACVYINKEGNEDKRKKCKNNNNAAECVITGEDLIKASLIDSSIKNPVTSEEVGASDKIKVTWSSGEQICVYQD